MSKCLWEKPISALIVINRTTQIVYKISLSKIFITHRLYKNIQHRKGEVTKRPKALPKFKVLILKRHLFIWTGIFLLIGPPLLTLKSWESWIEEKTTSKTHAMRVSTSFPGYSLYFEKVPWLRLVKCLSMPTQAASRVGGVRQMQTADLQTRAYIYMLPIPSLIANLNNLTEVLFWLTGLLVWLTGVLVWLTEVLVWLTQARVCKSAVCICRTPEDGSST